MTYCVAIRVNDGLVFCSDSRTNAGPDVLSSYSKMNFYKPDADRRFCILTAGNLATTQAIINQIEFDLESPEREGLGNLARMNDIATYVTNVSRNAQIAAQSTAGTSGVDVSASLLLGGQIRGAKQDIFLIYSAGNFISASKDVPFLQIGENKYGKPILDRIIRKDTSLEDAARCALVSMDSTIKSNATVGPPVELLVLNFSDFSSERYDKFEADAPYLVTLKNVWDVQLKQAFTALPKFEWENLAPQPGALDGPNN